MHCTLLSVLMNAFVLTSVTSFPVYQKSIPNGDFVPHPCKPNTIWGGVGHFLDEGSGHRNPFGQDFENEGKIWTEALCRKDSDDDGLTNGQELGDPDCVWEKGSIPRRQSGLSHPGICDPWDSPACSSKNISHPKYHNQEHWMREMCKSDEFMCPGINELDVQTLYFTLPKGSEIPAKPATYMCQIFDLESMIPTGDYHLIATEPILDNKNAVHHIVLFGCIDDQVAMEPYECGMVPSMSCPLFLSVWTVGLNGECFHPQTGVRLGVHGYKRLAMQYHWNNPESLSNLQDGSGMKLYYTSNRRQNDAGIFMTGMENFILPPGQTSVTVKSTCTSACTSKKFEGPVWITKAWNHMHYLGRQMSIQVFRNKTFLTNLTNDDTYSMDSPKLVLYSDNPVQILPGDEIVTTCHYETTSRAKSIFYGEGTTNEMCFAFLSYYPMENLKFMNTLCFTRGPDISYCDSSTYQGCDHLTHFADTTWLNSTAWYQDLVRSCRPFTPCLQECADVIVDLKTRDPCFQDEILDYIKYEMLRMTSLGQDIMARLSSCEGRVNTAL